MSRKRKNLPPRQPQRPPKSQELKDAQNAVHTFQLAIEQGLPWDEAYEFLVYDLIDAVRYEDIVFIRSRLEADGYDGYCTCGSCIHCTFTKTLQDIEDDLL